MVRDYSPEELSYLAATFAAALADDLDAASIKVLCSFFVSVVSTLNLIAAQQGLRKECCGRTPPPPGPPGGEERPNRPPRAPGA